jgi:hypothetical protein
MRSGAIPFQFDMVEVLNKANRLVGKHVGNITLNLPFVSIGVNPKDREKQIAREIVVRLKDRRVLSAWECCDDCIERALKSLQEIRALLVEKEVELAEFHEGPLFLVVEAMAIAVRQFLTFEQHLATTAGPGSKKGSEESHRFAHPKQDYYDGLEMLRGHLSRCLGQVAAVAGMKGPTNGMIENYQGDWQIEAYKAPTLLIAEKHQNAEKNAK